MTMPSPTENTTIIPPNEAKGYLAKRDIDADYLATCLLYTSDAADDSVVV